MKQKLKRGEIPFTQVANIVINDKTLSWKAKGLFAYLYSKPNDWDFSYDRIMKDSSDGKAATLTGLQELEKAGYLQRIKHGTGRKTYLIQWERPTTEKQELEPTTENPYLRKSQVAKIGTISNIVSESNKEEETNIDPATSAGKVVNEVLSLFKEVNPNYEILYKRPPQRKALERMIKKFGREKMEGAIKVLVKTNGQNYAPMITTPIQLEENLGKLVAFVRRSKENNNKVAIII